jgi:hypothetical protein
MVSKLTPTCNKKPEESDMCHTMLPNHGARFACVNQIIGCSISFGIAEVVGWVGVSVYCNSRDPCDLCSGATP